MLARFGVPEKMLTVIRQFHEGMRARVRKDAVTHAVVVRFSEDPHIVRDLVHLEEELEENAAGVSSDPLACVRRAVWGMLYADDAGIMS